MWLLGIWYFDAIILMIGLHACNDDSLLWNYVKTTVCIRFINYYVYLWHSDLFKSSIWKQLLRRSLKNDQWQNTFGLQLELDLLCRTALFSLASSTRVWIGTSIYLHTNELSRTYDFKKCFSFRHNDNEQRLRRFASLIFPSVYLSTGWNTLRQRTCLF